MEVVADVVAAVAVAVAAAAVGVAAAPEVAEEAHPRALLVHEVPSPSQGLAT